VKSEVQWLTPAILATWEAEIRTITVGSQSEEKVRPYLKNTQHKRDWRHTAQEVESLLSKSEALSSNPNTTKKNVGKRKEEDPSIGKQLTNLFHSEKKSQPPCHMCKSTAQDLNMPLSAFPGQGAAE
jgi:hypothetical protein